MKTPEPQNAPGNNQETALTEIARPEDILPGELCLLPLEHKPLFPGQLLPMALDARVWGATFEHAQRDGGAVGVALAGARADAVAHADFRAMGTACRVHQIELHEAQLRVVLAGVRRFRIARWVSKRRPFRVRTRYFPEPRPAQTTEIRAHTTAIFNIIKELLPLNPMYREELKIFLNHFDIGEPSRLADFGASLTTAAADEVQQVLETVELLPRMQKTLVLLQKEVEIAKAQTEIRKHVEDGLNRRQREMFLREQLKFIQAELGISKDERQAEIDALREKISRLSPPKQASGRIEQELEKMAVLERGSAEYTVTRNYLDWLCALPWGVFSEDSLDIKRAEKILNADHEGLAEVKLRILEFIAVGAMKGKIAGSILLLAGPPGVGKTSLGRSVAAALGREFFRFSLGGMHDEAEIKGHRRTYIGAMPGKFVQALRECKTANPVIMLDEIDKIGSSFRGDPASALLEVLDPEQNKDFLDHYLDVRLDLSNVLFICTANQLDTIPGPLLDRMETVRLSGYLAAEKVAIARRHLLPRQLQRAGLQLRGQLRIGAAALRAIAEQYAREAGVRKFEKMLGAIARKAAMKLLQGEAPPLLVTARNLGDYLGKPPHAEDARIRGVGVVTGLAWTALGGATLDIEASRAHGFSRGLKLTGQLGDVMKESAEIAYSYVLGNAEQLGLKKSFFKNAMLHLHVPAGATPKDGPSAGITMASALISLARGKRVKPSLGMSGEISLTGQVLPVGGIREKVIAARRANLRNLLLPEANRGDFAELPAHVKKGLKVHFVPHYREVLGRLFAA
ncbi:MAG: endopeptidase La [Gammaproteobacteria bacterium]